MNTKQLKSAILEKIDNKGAATVSIRSEVTANNLMVAAKQVKRIVGIAGDESTFKEDMKDNQMNNAALKEIQGHIDKINRIIKNKTVF